MKHQEITIIDDRVLYSVYENGEIWSKKNIMVPVGTKGRKFSGKFTTVECEDIRLKTQVNSRGYESVSIKKKTKMIHRLVAECFIENPESKPFVNHIDGNKLNNNASNLEWCTNKENMKHAFRAGLLNKKSLLNLVNNSALSIEDVKYIRTNYKARDKDFGGAQLAIQFGVSAAAISAVVKKKTYTDSKYF